ncbi:uncharacterized protein LOC126555614 [Aphis gossypii]|uniref:uncharacterized protein LOC126555614 n=1 Tax=Aphis gossypii TaxID=80765 RepID=UPI0021592CAE|nr:uncharacterized protein LOC126555614 [Aphis gossypii]
MCTMAVVTPDILNHRVYDPKSRSAIVLCMADDKYTEQFVDPILGFRSHKTGTSKLQLQLTRIEHRIWAYQKDLYARSVNKNLGLGMNHVHGLKKKKGMVQRLSQTY